MALVVLIIAVAAMAVHVHGLHQLRAMKDAMLALRSIAPRFLLTALALDVLSLLLNGMLWTRLLRCMGHRLPLRVGLAAYLSAGVAGYLANAAGSIVGTAVILRRHGIRPGRVALITLLANALGFCALLVLAPLSVLLFIRSDMRMPLPIIGRHGVIALVIIYILLGAVMLLVLQALATAPRTCNALARRVLGGTPAVQGTPIALRQVLALVPWSAAAWVSSALAVFVLLSALHPDAAHRPLMILGSMALASTLGALAFFVPEGLGVREGVLLTLLAHSAGLPVIQTAITIIAMRALDPLTKLSLLLALGIGRPLHSTAHGRNIMQLPGAIQPAEETKPELTGPRTTSTGDEGPRPGVAA
jgi:hypothetical protein